MNFNFNWFEELLLCCIVILIAICLFLAVTKCLADIPDTTIILCPDKADTTAIDTIKTVKKEVRK